MSESLRLLPEYLAGHLRLALPSLALGCALSIPLGIWLTRRERSSQLVLGAAGVIQTIPGLALLALMVPALAALSGLTSALLGVELRSIGFLPALIALTLYSVLPVLQNTIAGIRTVDPATVEAARGVGMTDRQQLARVELPLALPVIVAGLRTATVWVVGTATLSTPVGATSLGNFIFSGLQTRNFVSVWVGCVAAAGLAVLLDQLIRLLELGLRRRSRALVGTSGAVLAALYLLTFGSFAAGRTLPGESSVSIGSKTFTEQYILADFLGLWLERELGVHSAILPSLGSTVLFDALRSGEIDLYVDYSGTLWATILQREGPPGSRQAVLEDVSTCLERDYGIRVAAALGFENTYALAMRRDRAHTLGITNLTELARSARALEIGGDYEFFVRAEWDALVRTYGFDFRAERSMDSSLMYQAAAAGEVDVISAFSTDGRIAAFELELLRDDRGVIPPYDAVLLAGPRLVREQPGLVRALGGLNGILDEATMQQLNLAVDREGRSPAEVAARLLARLGPAD